MISISSFHRWFVFGCACMCVCVAGVCVHATLGDSALDTASLFWESAQQTTFFAVLNFSAVDAQQVLIQTDPGTSFSWHLCPHSITHVSAKDELP